MNILHKLAVAFVVVLTISEAFAKQAHICLDGDWRFADATAKKAETWDQLPVPGSWNTFIEYADYVGDAWYQRQVEIPRTWKKKHITLNFDAVYDIADVWFNNHYLGQHTGGYTPFEFEITEFAKPGTTGTLTVKVNNEHVVGAWFQWGGIKRSVHLLAHDDLRLIRQKIEPVLDLGTGTAQVKLLVTVANNGLEDQRVKVAGTIKELDDVAFHLSGKVIAGSQTTLSDQITLNSEQIRLWHFDDPQLYHLETTLSQDNNGTDTRNDRFGIRHIAIQPDGLYLNGEKIRIMVYNRVHDHRAYDNTEPRHLVRADIDMMKRSGANFSRIMHAPSAPELLDYCDERGYMIWAEIPMWQRVYRIPMNNAEDAQKARTTLPGMMLREMIQRDWNHPCILGWSPGNELRKEANLYVEAMRPLVKSLDPTRPYANIHYQGFQQADNTGYQNICAKNVDMLLINKYGNHDTKIKHLLKQHEAVPELPIFYSEYGQGRNESLNHNVDFAPLWQRLGQESYVIGGAPWTFNDYRSYYKQTPPSQNRDWGAVDIWRNPKTLYYQFTQLQQPVRSITVTPKGQKTTVIIQPRVKLEIPSFTLRGYRWAYELLDQEGHVLEGALHGLPDIAPDSPAIERSIAWKTTDAELLVISLISSTGYTVAETRYNLIKGHVCPLPSFPEPKNPELRKVLPLDRSFMVGVTSLEGDTGLEVRYGSRPGNYDQSLQAPVKGAIRVRGLTNGQTYFGQVRRLEADGPGPWSEEFRVAPDGHTLPHAPIILGAIEGSQAKAVRLQTPEKVCAYQVTLSTGKTMQINCAIPGLLIVPLYSTHLAVIGEYGISETAKL